MYPVICNYRQARGMAFILSSFAAETTSDSVGVETRHDDVQQLSNLSIERVALHYDQL